MTWPQLWTEQMIQDVHALMMTGATAAEVGAKTGFSGSALIAKMKREFGGWGVRHTTRIIKETKPTINEALIFRDEFNGKMSLTEEGERYLRSAWANPSIQVKEIAATFRITRTTVMHLRRQLGLKPRGRITNGAKPAKIEAPKWVITPWPDDMPRFDVYERADKIGKRIFI